MSLEQHDQVTRLRAGMRWIHFWRIIGVLALLDAVALGMWAALGFGLRGTSYEEGRPAPEDEISQALVVIGLSVTFLAHVAVAAYGVVRGQREPWAASLGAAVMVPVTLPVGVILVGGALRLWFG